MDREFVLTVLAPLVGGSATLVLAWLPAPGPTLPTETAWNHLQRCGRRLWLPLLPTALAGAALSGWAVQEPDNAELVPMPVLIVAALFVGVWCRALVRALRSARAARHTNAATAITVGLLRPRAVLPQTFIAQLDAGTLDAVYAHEAAHVRHRDPARIWLAQLAADLQWPFPAAVRRLHAHLHALELARDEEVRAHGVDGADLAAGILAAVRVAGHAGGTAGLTGATGDNLRARIERLLVPLPPAVARSRRATARTVGVAMLFPVAFLTGTVFGESLVNGLLRWLSG